MEHRKTTAESTHGKSETQTQRAAYVIYKCKKYCSLSTTYNGEKTHRKQQK